jgi:hypothetical protein
MYFSKNSSREMSVALRNTSWPSPLISTILVPRTCPWAVEAILADGWRGVVALAVPRDDRDFDAWARQQAPLLRACGLEALDVEHLAEEVEDLRQHQRIEVECHLAVLCLHLLLWTALAEDWDAWGRRAITGARILVEGFLEMSPGLQGALRARRRRGERAGHARLGRRHGLAGKRGERMAKG